MQIKNMFNLLPEEEKKNILVEYAIRRIIVLLLFLFVSGLIATISIFPSMLLSSSKTQEVEKQIEVARSSPILKEEADLNSRLTETNLKLSALMPIEDSISVDDLINRVIQKKSDGIRLSGFFYRHASSKTSSGFSISGVAEDRESLSTFVKNLQGEALFTKVDLPVSNFTKDKDATFSIQISGKF
jgi:hypothetical protein